jgi:hypothetical protein
MPEQRALRTTLVNPRAGCGMSRLIPGSASIPALAIEERNRIRFKAYDSLDVRVIRVFALRRGVLDVFGEITNATSRENPCCAQYQGVRNVDGGRTYARDVDNWLPLGPSIGVLWRY